MTSTVVCTIDSSHPRWRRTPIPNQNSMVLYSGHFSGAAAGGRITVGLKNITLYVGGRNNGTNMTAASGSKKRKFMSTLSQEYASSFLNVVSLNGNSGETTGIVPPEKLSPAIGEAAEIPTSGSSTASEHPRILLHPGVKVTTNITFEEFLL